MKKFYLSTLLMLISLLCSHANVNIVPLPASVSMTGKGSFKFDSKTTWHLVDISGEDRSHLATFLSQQFPETTISATKHKNQITLRIAERNDSNESYRLNVSKHNINIISPSAAGLFYGIQTLRQLLDQSNDSIIEAMSINDSPRFPYRGMMIDVSRNFRSKEFIMKQIDAMAMLKLNRLHLHLTDGAGWRVEIKRYPRLTQFAAWRHGDTWKQWDNHYCEQTDPDAHGGYYTKEDIAEIVKYAADRFMTVIPEIEMPGHSEEVLAAYPELSCAGKPYSQSDFCVGNDSTFEFIEGVLDEIIEMFPSKYIHIGGDEASKEAWKNCPKCLHRMEQESLDNVDRLQSYLIHRVEQYLNSKGRELIGWDEIMQGGLAPNATVLSWRGPEHGWKAAAEGHNAVMAPGRFCYFDGYQDAPHTQPEAIGGYLPIDLVYSFNPAPDSLSAETRANIKGIEATMFTEYIATDQHAEYMLYPRMLALAEVAWSPQELREYPDFRQRATIFNDRLCDNGYNVFNMHTELGNRPEATEPVKHLARGKKVIYNNCRWMPRYIAGGDTTLTDGLRGGWIYTDGRWQGFFRAGTALDVTIDLEQPTDIQYIGADFIQLCPPNVWFPREVIISVSNDGESFTELTRITTNLLKDNKIAFRNFSWAGNVKARYVRYQACHDQWHFVFTDEIVIR